MTDIESRMKEITETLLEKMEFPYSAVAVTTEGHDIIRVNIDTDESSLIIGRHGETMNALQHVLKSLLRNSGNTEENFFLIVDADGYKKRQEENVIDMAEQEIKRLGDQPEVLLPPMSPYFRRLIHLHFVENPDHPNVTTESVGEGAERQVKIMMKA